MVLFKRVQFNRFLLVVLLLLVLSNQDVLAQNKTSSKKIEEKLLVVVVVSYNNIDWYENNLKSIFQQNYTNYRVLYVDDCSCDGTAEAVEDLVHTLKQDFRFTMVRNVERLGSPLANHYQAIHQYCDDDEIVVCVDGDDWLAHTFVLQRINEVYSSDEIWLTHGSLIENPMGFKGWSIPIPETVVMLNTFREFRCPSHLKTFYAWLFKKIKKEDLFYHHQFFPATGDQAMMFPMIEMASERHAFIPDILYVYNRINVLGESLVNKELQKDCEEEIRSMKPYTRLLDSPEAPKL